MLKPESLTLFQPTTTRDVYEVSTNIREFDVKEAGILYPEHTAHQLFFYSMSKSAVTKTLKDGSNVLGICGVARVEGYSDCAVWLIGTPKLDRLCYRKEIIRQAPVLLDQWVSEYGSLFNYCSDDEKLLRALKLVGFEISDDDQGRDRVRMIRRCA